MRTKTSNAEKIREAVKAGEKPRDISKRLNIPVSTVYTVSWKMRQPKKRKRIVISKERADLAKRLNIPLEKYARALVAAEKKATPYADFIKEELENVEQQIGRLQTIASFLTIRQQQLAQNGE